jgi:hypothetical protein
MSAKFKQRSLAANFLIIFLRTGMPAVLGVECNFQSLEHLWIHCTFTSIKGHRDTSNSKTDDTTGRALFPPEKCAENDSKLVYVFLGHGSKIFLLEIGPKQ